MKLCVLILTFLMPGLVLSQSISINRDGSPPHPGTIVDIRADSAAILLPGSDTASILNPIRGFIIFDTSATSLYQYNGFRWLRLLDESAFQYSFADRDVDGFGDKYAALYATNILPGYVLDSTDCNDGDPEIHPGANELCDGVDNDCNSATNDGIDEPTLGTPCDGPDSDACEEGIWECVNGVLTCSDMTSDSVEVCDGVDNDCDGFIDEGCAAPEWGNVQFPFATSTVVDVPTELIYGQVYAEGVTDQSGQGLGFVAQLGYGTDGSDPALGGWTWVNAIYNTDSGNNDEYQASLTLGTAGTYDYAYRYSGDGGVTWLYCDTGTGSADGYSPADAGDLLVTGD